MQYVYKLNVVSVDGIMGNRPAVESVFKLSDKNHRYMKIAYYTAKQIIRPNMLNYMGINWDHCSLFIRNHQASSSVHKDFASLYKFYWAINWVWRASCRLEFWNDEIVPNFEIVGDGPTDRVNNKNDGKYILGYPEQPASATYILEPGSAYLINTSVFHRATTIEPKNRYTLSIRSSTRPFNTWEQTVKYFDKYIEN